MKQIPFLTALALALPLACNAAAAADPAAIRQRLADAIVAGNLAGALALYAPDAVVDGSGQCAESPCTDRKAIEADLKARIESRNRPKTLASHVSGNVLTTKLEVKSDAISDIGFGRIRCWVIYEIKDGKIAAERVILDRGDDETRRYVEWVADFVRTSREGVPIEPR